MNERFQALFQNIDETSDWSMLNRQIIAEEI